MEETKVQEIHLSVHRLVEFLLRDGAVGNGSGAGRMQEGAKIHRMLQKAEGSEYQAEVFLSLQTQIKNTLFTIEGRADGVLTDKDGILIDEIKSTATPLAYLMQGGYTSHWAQGMCYAHMYCVKNEIEQIRVRLTYYQVNTEKKKQFIRPFTREELSDFYFDLLDQYRRWADFIYHWKSIRNASIQQLKFPYDSYRSGQRDFALEVYRTIQEKGTLFVQAPTGIGKTMSALFPSVKAMGASEADKIFYLTAKTTTQKAAEEAISLLCSNGLQVKTATLTAREKICFLHLKNCNASLCPFSDGYYTRVNDALYDSLIHSDHFTKEVVEHYAQKYQICPYEFSLDLAAWSDIIICDYNYLFAPMVYLRRFFKEKDTILGENYIFLIDEAHNLVDRAREMYSANLQKSAFLHLKRLLKKEDALYTEVSNINKAMRIIGKLTEESGFYKNKEPFYEFNQSLFSFLSCCEQWMKIQYEAPMYAEVLDCYFAVLHYMRVLDFYDSRSITYVDPCNQDICIKSFCLDPSHVLRECMNKGKASILFSATLTPLDYFSAVLGGDSSSRKLLLESPFDPAHLCLVAADKISTKYANREESLLSVVAFIDTAVRAKRGNYMVYFPSYQYLKAVVTLFSAQHPEIQTAIQHTQMNEEQRTRFLEQFSQDNHTTLVGFCVLGGIYAEGIDLKGNRLIGSIVIGVGLPQLNTDSNLIRDYFQEKYEMGYEYAYVYPGMNKILQAAGRVIRSETDIGMVLLMDERFATPPYQRLFPEHWRGMQLVGNCKSLQKVMERFWKNVGDEFL